MADSGATQPRYDWRLLRAGPLRLDGGSMFGVIPRVVWSKLIPTDELGRIEVTHNCLLLTRANPAEHAELGASGDDPDSSRRSSENVLIETGSGNKFDAKSRQIFGLTDYTILDALREAGVSSESVRHVIPTHLHFDHAGGLTRKHAGRDDVTLTFPNADVIVQRREWDDANANRSVMTRTYLKENLDPIRDRLRLIDSPEPFDPGAIRERDQLPATSLQRRTTAVLPGVDVFLVPGHTWGQQAVRFTDARGCTIVFTPDVLPTANHVGSTYNLAYDVEPYTSTLTRRWFLEAAVESDWLLVLVHEPHHPLQRVRRDGKGWYHLVPEEAR
jgi:glyoxylase-like metal-dependent hydrolase (beta-lactamase superfamily II)